MKININPTNLSGYVNIKPEYDHMKNLDTTVEDAEATEILCFEAIRRVPYTEIGNFLSHLVKKMRLNSKLVVIHHLRITYKFQKEGNEQRGDFKYSLWTTL